MNWDIGKIISKRAKLSPDKTAVIHENFHITYKQLNEESNRVANYLIKKGIKQGDRISTILLNCPEFLSVYFAAAKLGVIFVPLNYRMVSSEIKFQLNDCGSRLLFYHDVFQKNIFNLQKTIKVEKDKFIFMKSGLPTFISCPEWAVNYHDAIQSQKSDEPVPDKPIGLDDTLGIIYTSGVTGTPKGAALSHGQTYFKIFQIIIYTDLTSKDIMLSQLPLFHSAGLFIIATPCLCRGATFIMRRKFNPKQFTKDIEKYRATFVFGLTTMWRLILQSDALENVDIGSVKRFMGGGEWTSSRLRRDLKGKNIFLQQGFGQTENSGMMMIPFEDITKKENSVGLPGFFNETWIEDSLGNKLSAGEIGEIVAKGPTVMSGYWNMSGQTEKTIVDGVLRTGDLGYMDKDGYFYIIDRIKDMYRTGGENVYPAEIENILCNHPKIEHVAIIGLQDEQWGETGKAFIVAKKGKTLTKQEIYEFLVGKVAKYKFPAYIEFTDSLPFTATGKIKKIALKEKNLLKYN